MNFESQIINGREIIYVNYSGLKPPQMIELFDEVTRFILNPPRTIYFLVDFNGAYVNHEFSVHSKEEFLRVRHLVDRIGFIGLNAPKIYMINAYRYLFKANFAAFDSYEQAMEYLLA